MTGPWYVGRTWAWQVIWATAACAGTPPARDVTPRDMGSAAKRGEPGEATRGMRVEGGLLGAPSSPPFVLEATLRARRIQDGISIALGELHDGGTVKSGDRLQISIRTSGDAYLYLAFCSQLAVDPRSHGLTVFPPQGSIRVNANEITTAPDKEAEIVLDDKPGQESLYLIFSHVELSHADPRLAEAITAARQAGKTAGCGERFRGVLAGPDKVKPKPRSPQREGLPAGSGDPLVPGPSNLMSPVPIPEVEPIVGIERGADIAWNGGVNGDATGIAILRYGLTHVGPRSTSRSATARTSSD